MRIVAVAFDQFLQRESHLNVPLVQEVGCKSDGNNRRDHSENANNAFRTNYGAEKSNFQTLGLSHRFAFELKNTKADIAASSRELGTKNRIEQKAVSF